MDERDESSLCASCRAAESAVGVTLTAADREALAEQNEAGR